MARIRTIKPEFFTHWDLYELEKETGLPIRVAFAGLWTQADREGRFQWIPQQLKLGCLPYDEIDFSRVLHALATRGFIKKYTVDEREFGYIPGFLDHQVINNRETPSKLPKPTDSSTLTRAARVDDASGTRTKGKGREGKGREGIKNVGEKSSDEKEKNKAKKFSEQDMNLAQFMFSRIQLLNPDHKEPNFDSWADTIRLMRERDGRASQDIGSLFVWANKDSFWKTNILSPGKLREQWDKLTIQRNNRHAPGNGSTGDSYTDRLDRAEKLINDAAGQ
jgi:hypothetical protein